MKHAVLIPARLASSRLPQKLLLAETGKPVIVHTCERVAQAVGSDAVCVCADDPAIVAVVEEAGYRAYMTRPDHQSGTDRIAEVAAQLDVDIIVNVQGDEPEIEPEAITQVIALLEQHHWADIATLAVASSEESQHDPNAVKVIIGQDDRALWFSRAPVVWNRAATAVESHCWRHVGIYAYRREALLGYHQLPQSPLEASEQLEQLRGLAAGLGIACGVISASPAGIDVQADYNAFVARHRHAQS